MPSVDVVDGVYKHNCPDSVELYDKMWQDMDSNQSNNVENWGNNRIVKIFQMFGCRVDFSGLSVLDACCGLGRFSVASLELNADKVFAVDGSFCGPQAILNRIKNNQIPPDQNSTVSSVSPDRFFPVQANIENINDVFNDNSVDVVLHIMSLHHMEDYKKTLRDLARLLKSGGCLLFNFFTTGETPQVAFDLREVFVGKDFHHVYGFLLEMGKIKGREDCKIFDFAQVVGSNELIAGGKYDDIVVPLRTLSKKYDTKMIEDRIHLEDFQTPFLHNFEHFEVRNFVVNELGLSIVREQSGIILAAKSGGVG